MKLNNGATVLRESRDIVLAEFRGEFVTWTVSEDGDAYWGHYFGDDRARAHDDYRKRTGERSA